MTAVDVPVTADATSSPRRSLQGWKLVVALVAPYLVIQLWHEISPSTFPDFFSIVPEDQVVPFRDWFNDFFIYLKDEEILGLFSFRSFTRWISGLLEYPLEFSEYILVDGVGSVLGLFPLPWVTVVGLAAVIGAWLGGWRLGTLGAVGMFYLAIFDIWEESLITLSFVLTAAPVAAILGALLGLVAAKWRWFEQLLIPFLNVLQSTPQFSYLFPIAIFVGIGDSAGAIAMILFALAPMARLTILGLQGVSPEVLDAGLMGGCTPWQMLRKVELPAAKPQLMVGVNQVIMQCFGMTVLASFVGMRGLGTLLLNFLQSLRLGKALQVGVAIVIMAILLDRLSQAAAQRKPEHRDPDKAWWQLHPHAIAAGSVVVGGWILAQISDTFRILPRDYSIDTSPFWESIVDWVQINVRGPAATFGDWVLLEILIPMRNGFESLPWIGLLVLVAAIGWHFGGWRLAATVSGFVLFLAFSGFWIESMETLYLVVAALIISVIVGIPLGIFAASTDGRTRMMEYVLDTFQVLPSFIYLIPVVMVFRVGPMAALTAILIYSTVPAVRFTMLGLRNVPAEVVEAAKTSGCTNTQVLRKVKLPMAFPEIMLGINQVLMFGLLLVIIAAFIGGIEGLGDEILRARTEQRLAGEALLAGLCVAAMGLTVDQIVRAYSRRRRIQLGLDEPDEIAMV